MRMAHTMIRVRDLDKALAFYVDFIGLREVRRAPMGDATLIFLTDESSAYYLELTLNHGRRDYELGNQFGHLAFVVDDLEAVVREVEARGWWYRRSRPESRSQYIFVKDPDGYEVEILAAKTAPTPTLASS